MLFAAAAAGVAAQPAGGKTTTPETKPKTNSSSSTPKPTKPTKPTTPSSSKRPNTAPASIDGKWWTSGNDFGASEVVFTQTGANVTGVIRYSDGRTGTVNGTMVNKRLQFTFSSSDGNSGSGWLELSWNNFLGGPWRNARVRDGSWTMMRIEGKWCFGGSRSRIRTVTHDQRGDMFVIAEDGTRSTGQLQGPWIYLTSDDGITIKGDTDFRANRINWSTGFFWTWCGRN
ncbi:MAG TPA: hypothetical protein VIT19_07415 [Pyrinomonadaceae bacterium]